MLLRVGRPAMEDDKARRKHHEPRERAPMKRKHILRIPDPPPPKAHSDAMLGDYAARRILLSVVAAPIPLLTGNW